MVVPCRLQPGALRRPLLAVALATTATGCVSTQTSRALDRSYDLAKDRPQKTPTQSASKLPTPSDADLSGPLERDVIVAQAVARSPALALMSHRARALVHAGRAEGSLPTAELGFEAWNLPLTRPYALGEADMYMVELRQRFPAAGSLDARARAMAEEAQAMLAELASEERLVAERAASAFADLAQAVAEKRLQQKQLALLDRMSQAVRARYATGGSALADAARIDVEVAKTRRAVARVEGDIARSRATLNAVLRRAPGAPLGEPREVPVETVQMSVEALMARATTNRGATLSAEARHRAATARREAAEAEARAPEFMVGLGYWQDPTMRPGVGITTSMSLPWLWGPNRHRVEQAKEEEAAEQAAINKAEVDARADVTETHARLRALEAQLVVVQAQGLPAARRSLEALAAAYTTGNAMLLDWVDVTRSVLDLEMEAAELRGDIERSAASLERAVGTALPKTPIQKDASR